MVEVWKCEILKFLLAGFKLYASNENNSSIAPVTYSILQNTVSPATRKNKTANGVLFNAVHKVYQCGL
jgi:hypothetical protein